MTQLSDVETGERLVVEIFDGRPMAFRGLTPVAFEDSRALYTLLKENDGIANGAVVFVIDGIVTMELS